MGQFVRVEDLKNLENIVYLVGDARGRSLVTGEVSVSSLVPGAYSIETEHGVLHLDGDYLQEVFVEDF